MRGFIGLLFYSVLALAPILTGVFYATRFLHRERFMGFATVAVVVGFLAGGIAGWALVPAQWTASFWTTVDAAGDSVKYGEPFEHTAERALMYVLFPAALGAAAFGVAALLWIWRVPARRLSSARPAV